MMRTSTIFVITKDGLVTLSHPAPIATLLVTFRIDSLDSPSASQGFNRSQNCKNTRVSQIAQLLQIYPTREREGYMMYVFL